MPQSDSFGAVPRSVQQAHDAPERPVMPSTEDLAAAIAQMEGFNKTGSLAQRNNNPGNLRAGPSAVGKDANGLAVFATAADGWHDLYHQIDLDAQRGLTLAGFIGKYAPPSE